MRKESALDGPMSSARSHALGFSEPRTVEDSGSGCIKALHQTRVTGPSFECTD